MLDTARDAMMSSKARFFHELLHVDTPVLAHELKHQFWTDTGDSLEDVIGTGGDRRLKESKLSSWLDEGDFDVEAGVWNRFTDNKSIVRQILDRKI